MNFLIIIIIFILIAVHFQLHFILFFPLNYAFFGLEDFKSYSLISIVGYSVQ